MSRSKRRSRPLICDTPEVHPALREYFGYCFYKAALRLRASITDTVIAGGLAFTQQLGILVILRSSEPINQVTLGQALGIDKATMVKLIDGLEKRKLVERLTGSHDRRTKRVRITPRGREFSLKLQAEVRQVEERFLSKLTAEEQRVLRGALPKLLQDGSEPDSR